MASRKTTSESLGFLRPDEALEHAKAVHKDREADLKRAQEDSDSSTKRIEKLEAELEELQGQIRHEKEYAKGVRVHTVPVGCTGGAQHVQDEDADDEEEEGDDHLVTHESILEARRRALGVLGDAEDVGDREP